jgi:hypothetical protein
VTENKNGAIETLERPRAANPFSEKAPALPATAATDVAKQRAIAETQAAMVIAQQFPRDEAAAMERILKACMRPTLAEKATYEYARGGSKIVGPSIRLAEAIAQSWGNFDFGFRELEQRNGESTVETYAWDIQTNTRSTRLLQVKHERHTNRGTTRLTDPRDIYELVANQAARRIRANILALIPGDVVEAAVDQAEQTLQATVDVTPESIERIVMKFGEVGVTRRALEIFIQRRIDMITPALVVRLRGIYNSIKDGMSNPGDWFEIEAEAPAPTATSQTERVKEKIRRQNGTATPAGDPAAEPEEPETPEETGAATKGAQDPPAQGSAEPAQDEPEAEMLAKMSGPELTRFVKGEAKRLGVTEGELEEIVASAGGWKKQNAPKTLELLREFANAGGAGA